MTGTTTSGSGSGPRSPGPPEGAPARRAWGAVGVCAVFVSLAWLAPLMAQAPGSQGEPLTPQEQAALELVERILSEDDRAVSGDFSYESGGRRDPFRSLLQPSQTQAVAPPSARPQGLAGLLVQDARVTGIARYLGGWHAVLTAPDGQTYFARVGAQLYDGRIVEIAAEEVIFEQEVEDALGNRRVRQVVKRLRTE